MRFSATGTISGSPGEVLRTLEDVRSLAAWNPALGSFGEGDARVIIGKRYRTRIRGIVSASIVVDELEEGRLRYRMHALGSTERGAWSWSSLGPERTRVTHVFDHHGFLINLMSAAFEQVPNWRLGRLAAEVARRARGAAG